MPVDWEAVLRVPPYEPRDYEEGAVRLDLNESPFPPPPEVVEAVVEEARRANRYPEARLYRELQEELASYVGVEPDEVVVTAGGDDALARLFALPTRGERRMVRLDPSFSMLDVYASLYSWRVSASRLRPSGDAWVPNEDELLQLAAGASMVVLDQPNNPTGTGMVSRATMLELARLPALLVVDEAYYEFSGVSSVDLVSEGDVVVVRTLSKAFSLAGLRVGYMVAERGLARALRRLVPPFAVPRTSLAAALAALRTRCHVRVVEAVRAERERLLAALRALGARPYRSLANFLLVDTGVEGAADELARARVYVRRVNLGPTWVRVTVGSRADNDALLKALRELLRRRPAPPRAARP